MFYLKHSDQIQIEYNIFKLVVSIRIFYQLVIQINSDYHFLFIICIEYS
jgi:hypothetical protein